MILKYALFTLLVSTIPIYIIIKDLDTTLQISNLISSSISNVNLDLLQSILNSGLVTYFSSSEEMEREIDDHAQSTFTKENLKTFTGKNNKPIYLSILGNIFDVSKAKKYYGPGENYNVFTGKLDYLLFELIQSFIITRSPKSRLDPNITAQGAM